MITPIDSRGTLWQNGWDCTKPREEELQTETQQHFPNWHFTALFCWAGNSSSPGGGGSCLPNWRSVYLAFPSVPRSSGFPVNKACCLSLTRGERAGGWQETPRLTEHSWSWALLVLPPFCFLPFSSSEANTIPEAEISPRNSGWPGHRTSPPSPPCPLTPQVSLSEPPENGHWIFHGFHGIMQTGSFWKWNQSLAASAQGQKVWTSTASFCPSAKPHSHPGWVSVEKKRWKRPPSPKLHWWRVGGGNGGLRSWLEMQNRLSLKNNGLHGG